MSIARGVLGDYEAFAPREWTVDELVEMALRGDETEIERTSVTLGSVETSSGRIRLVRYQLRSRELDEDMKSLGLSRTYLLDAPRISSVIGLLEEETASPLAVVEALVRRCAPDGVEKPEIHAVWMTESPSPRASEAVLNALSFIGLPPGRRSDVKRMLALRADIWHDDDKGWHRRDPEFLVRVRFRRSCFYCDPVPTETFEVLFRPVASRPIDSADKEIAYRSRRWYEEEAWDHFPDQARQMRPGYSDWLTAGDVELVKAVGRLPDGLVVKIPDPSPAHGPQAAAASGPSP